MCANKKKFNFVSASLPSLSVSFPCGYLRRKRWKQHSRWSFVAVFKFGQTETSFGVLFRSSPRDKEMEKRHWVNETSECQLTETRANRIHRSLAQLPSVAHEAINFLAEFECCETPEYDRALHHQTRLHIIIESERFFMSYVHQWVLSRAAKRVGQ